MKETISERLEQNKKSIIDAYLNNISMNKLGESYNCNSGTIYYKLKEWKVPTKARKKFKGKIEDYLLDILHMFDNENKTIKDISRKLNVSAPTVQRVLSENGRDTSKFFSGDPDNLLKDKADEVVKLYSEGNSTIKIAEILGYNSVSIWHLLQKLGVDTTLDKYDVDESFFEKIDTEIKAYCVGMMASDGNVTYRNNFRIALQERDKPILERIKLEMKFEGPLYYKKPKNERSQAQWELNISRKKLCDDLIKLGIVPAKSNILQFPTEEQVPKHLVIPYLRGVFDGDGGFSIRKNKYLSANFTGCFAMCDGIEKTLKEHGIECKQYYRKDKKYTSQLMINKHAEAVKFGKLLYKDSQIHMDRKYQKFLPFA